MSTITKEWLQKAISQHEALRDEIPFGLGEDDSNTLAALRIALASLEADPVAWMVKDIDTGEKIIRSDRSCFEGSCQPLYTAPPAPVMPEEAGSSLQLRNLIRQRHAEWSQATFGDVGPVGPLKHLSKEALEAAAEPNDLSEWADMQFLLWDAQRRSGISDGEITAAMEEKLKVNMARQWPEPKDGEPRLHIKAAAQQEVK